MQSTVVSNVSTLVPRLAARPEWAPAPQVGEAGNVIAFPRHKARSEPKLRGTVAWAEDVVAVDRRLSFAAVDARKRLNRLVHETLPRPMFVADGAGYENLSAIAARDLLADPCVAFGPEEFKLLAAVDRFESAQLDWARTRKQLSVSTGLDAILAARDELSDDAAEAYDLLRSHGIDPLHP